MRNAETYVAVCFAVSGRYGKFYFGILGKRGLHTNRHFIAVRLCPFDRGFVEEIDVDAVVGYRIDEFGQSSEPSRTLTFATGIVVFAPVFVADEHGVVDDAAVLGLVGDSDVVD